MSLPFRVVRGTEAAIQDRPTEEGYLYFSTDTKKIYMGKNGEKLPMGGNSGIYYGIRDSKPTDTDEGDFYFLVSEIEENKIPNINDLILNKDGCFYRVTDNTQLNEEEELIITTIKLTIAGSGTGPGGTSAGYFNLIKRTLGTSIGIGYGESCELSFKVDARYPGDEPGTYGEPTGNGDYILFVGGKEKIRGEAQNVYIENGMVKGGENTIDVGPYLSKGSNAVKIEVTCETGGEKPVTKSLTWTVIAEEVGLTWNKAEDQKYFTHNNFEFEWEISVSTTATNKKAYISIDGADFFETTETSYSIPAAELGHGVKTIEMYASAEIAGKTIYTPKHMIKQFIIIDIEETSPIISMKFFGTEMDQYTTYSIPIMIYDPSKSDNDYLLPINLWEGTTIVDVWNGNPQNQEVKNLVEKIWYYTPKEGGQTFLTLQYGSNTEDSESLSIYVNEVNIGGLKEVSGYAVKLAATDLASNNALKTWKDGDAFLEFNDEFDWINGGLIAPSENERRAICIKAGSQMKLHYPMFKKMYKNNQPTNAGLSFKMIFKTVKNKRFDAEILRSTEKWSSVVLNEEKLYDIIPKDASPKIAYSDYVTIQGTNENKKIVILHPKQQYFVQGEDFEVSETEKYTEEDTITTFVGKYIQYNNNIYFCEYDENNKRFYWYLAEIGERDKGLVLESNKAIFNSLIHSNLINKYYENNYVEFELDISDRQDQNGNEQSKYIKFWIDGVPCGSRPYVNEDNFYHTSNADDTIIIGSPDCDVYISLIKIYQNGLSDKEHLRNFIADGYNTNEILRRYNRNNILNGNLDEQTKGPIVINKQKLITQNPDCNVFQYILPNGIPQGKSSQNYVPFEFDLYKGDPDVFKYHGEGRMKVQGTSSLKYIISAANFDSNFDKIQENTTTGLVDIDGWSMNEKSIPINYTCTKVNVASCENANNALNQEWYNRFQPYRSKLNCTVREDGKQHRDTMEFINGVVFFIDQNTNGLNSSVVNSAKNVFCDTVGYDRQTPMMYSIGNMGNSKENTQVFHDLNNPLCCCVENTDNQTPQQWMVDYELDENTGLIKDLDSGKKYYEFRYIQLEDDGKTIVPEVEDKLRKAWTRFIRWMAHSNPQPRYKAYTIDDNPQEGFIKIDLETLEIMLNNNQKVYYLDPDGTTKIINPYSKTFENNGYKVNNEIELSGAYVEIQDVSELNEHNVFYTKTEHTYGYTNLPFKNKEQAITFDDKNKYVFNGVGKEEVLWDGYTPVIKGVEETTYINTAGYDADTYEYRMAKMLAECEDYLRMDSIVYHYLFIEQHCMIDNVAKNTFWSTEDGVHWDLTKDYDNDTADGNDNNGEFTRDYGMEVEDRFDDISYVFNARQSVWLQFVLGLPETRLQMYDKIAGRKIKIDNDEYNVWDYNQYLKLFSEWQSVIPEACWILDYYRKYQRPSILFNDSRYDKMMDGGQKKYQRQQFETMQNLYMNSRYRSGINNNSISLRGSNTTGVETSVNLAKAIKIPVTTYQDCYLQWELGGGWTEPIRAKRGVENIFYYPPRDLNNTTCDFFPASTFTAFGGPQPENVDYFSEPMALGPAQLSISNANKLQTLVMGTKNNPDLNTSLTGQISLSALELLKELYFSNYKGMTGALDLSACTGLEQFEGATSAFSSITFANGAPLKDITINTPATLTISNSPNIEEFTMGNGAQSQFKQLYLNNIDNIDNDKLYTQQCLNLILTQYDLQKVYWRYDYTDIELVKSILENLLTQGGERSSGLLSGTLEFINCPTDGEAIGIMQKFYEDYIYNTNNVDAVSSACFYNLDVIFKEQGTNAILFDKVQIFDGSGVLVWNKRIRHGTTFTGEFLTTGPKGAFNPEKMLKASTLDTNYEFNGVYKYNYNNSEGEFNGSILRGPDGDQKYEIVEITVIEDSGIKVPQLASGESITDIYPIPYRKSGDTTIPFVVDQDLDIYPDFNISTRYYTVTVKDGDGSDLMRVNNVEYGANALETIKNNLTKIPYKPDEPMFALDDLYFFTGYSEDAAGRQKLTDKSVVGQNSIYYACFEQRKAREVVFPMEWFKFERADLIDGIDYDSIAKTGYQIQANSKYLLRGKITIPTEYNGWPVVSLGGFKNTQVTHVFFHKDTTEFYRISANAFNENKFLQYIDLTLPSLLTIQQKAFRECSSLSYEDSCIFGPNLKSIGGEAFSFAFKNTDSNHGGFVLFIPSSVERINDRAFAYIPTTKGELKIGTPQELSRLVLNPGGGQIKNIQPRFIQENNNSSVNFTSVTFHTNAYSSEGEDTKKYFSGALYNNATISIPTA